MTYGEALAALPHGAAWSASFGYPGEGGYSEYWRTPDGRRFEISNGSYLDDGQTWKMEPRQ